MTENEIQMDPITAYSAYGYRQEEFGYLCDASQQQIIDHAYDVASMMNQAMDSQVVKVCADGYRITSGEMWAEIRATMAPRTVTLVPMTTTDPMYTGFYGVGHFA